MNSNEITIHKRSNVVYVNNVKPTIRYKTMRKTDTVKSAIKEHNMKNMTQFNREKKQDSLIYNKIIYGKQVRYT